MIDDHHCFINHHQPLLLIILFHHGSRVISPLRNGVARNAVRQVEHNDTESVAPSASGGSHGEVMVNGGCELRLAFKDLGNDG